MQDIEAQKITDSIDQFSSKSLPDYAHSGRGGAGNWYAPPELEKEGTFQSHIRTPTKDSTNVGGGYQGRGGAGNYNAKDEIAKKEVEQRVAEEARLREEEVTRDVGLGLKQPEKAYLTAERIGSKRSQ